MAPAASLARIFAAVRAAFGVDFSEYAPAVMKRRLARRIEARKAQDVSSYLELLQEEPGEVRALHDALLVHATSFFHDSEDFAELQATALPEILKHKAAGAPVRAWVVGCATGEEAYSLAMCVVESLDGSPAAHQVQVFGSDVSEKAIRRARAGLYTKAAMRGVGEERRSRFFVECERGWRVSKALRELCVFARHDVARDPPFTRLDLVSCRNVLAYFNHALQKEVLASLHHSLSQPGYLMLGRSVPACAYPPLFAPAAAGGRLFARKPGPSTFRLHARGTTAPFARGPRACETAGRTERSAFPATREDLETAKEELEATTDELTAVNDELSGRNEELQLLNADLVNLLETVDVPIVMLDASRRIRRFTPRAGAFLNLTQESVGQPIESVALQLQAPDLELWVAQAMHSGAIVESEVQDGADRWHRMQIRPHRALDGRADGTIVSLVDIHELKNEVADAEWERDYARSVIEGVQTPLVVIDGQLRVLWANEAYFTSFGASLGEVEGRSFFELGGGGWDTLELRRSLGRVLSEDARFRDLVIERDLPKAGRRTLTLSARSILSRASTRMILLGIE
jgi:chemotaxis methyl-accepting protein methylase/PAS domain-containing protein